MRIQKIIEYVEGDLVCCKSNLCDEIEKAFSSDLMSDVLRIDTNNVLLITGLSNIQTIRTAEMADISCVLIARGKQISQEMLELAKENDIAIISTGLSVFKVSGILYEQGIKPIF